MGYSLLEGGKKFRSLLMLASAETCGFEAVSVAPFLQAVEMVHCYSLVHDDLPAMDNDDFRRGRPTNHRKFGEDTAILCGDALLTLAFECASLQTPFAPEAQLRAIAFLAGRAGARGMIGGQIADVRSGEISGSRKTLEFIHRRKTGNLIQAAVCIPFILAERDAAQLELASEFSMRLGRLYQIQDDLMDLLGDESKAGKKLRKDDKLNKLTHSALVGTEAAIALKEEVFRATLEKLEKLEGDTGKLSGLIGRIYARES